MQLLILIHCTVDDVILDVMVLYLSQAAITLSRDIMPCFVGTHESVLLSAACMCATFCSSICSSATIQSICKFPTALQFVGHLIAIVAKHSGSARLSMRLYATS